MISKMVLIILLLLAGNAVADVDLYLQAHEDFRIDQITTEWTKADFIELWRQTHKGEVIDILPVGTDPGRMVKPPAFVKITVTGVTMEQARTYLEPLLDSARLLRADSLYDIINLWEHIATDSTLTVLVSEAMLVEDSATIKHRRFFFQRRVVDSALTLWAADGSTIVMTKQQAANLIKKYDVATIKQRIKDRLKQ